MARFRVGKIQRVILEQLEDVADVSVAFLTSAGSSRLFFKNLHENRKKTLRYQVARSLKDLEKKGLIRVIIKSGEPYIKKSPPKAIDHIDSLSLIRASHWDGVWRIVIFDIPERHGKARRALSFCIAKAGAVRLQDSVFVYPFPWKHEIEQVAEFFKVNPYVRYIEAMSIEGDGKLRRHFDV